MIQWFPGHMAKALSQIRSKKSLADIFVVVLDARAPISSYNHEFDDIAPHKPRLFVITKADLADKSKFFKIKQKFTNKNDKVIFVNLKLKSDVRKILQLIKTMLLTKKASDFKKGLMNPRLRVFVVGVPNAGKSTLINALAGKKKAKVGNVAGVTKGQQWINAQDIQLLDTPGILWPKFDDQLVAVKLAVIGSIKSDVIPLPTLFEESYKLLSNYYPQKIKDLGLEPSNDLIAIYDNLVLLCTQHNFLIKGQKKDLAKGRRFFINYVRNITSVTYE